MPSPCRILSRSELARLWGPMPDNGMDSFHDILDDGLSFEFRDLRIWLDSADPRACFMEPLPQEERDGRWREFSVPRGTHRLYYRGRIDIVAWFDDRAPARYEPGAPGGFTPDDACESDVARPKRELRHRSHLEYRRPDALRTLLRVGLDPLHHIKVEIDELCAGLPSAALESSRARRL